MQQSNTKELLVEVRKSYRLLYEYQSRILDLVDYIGKKFGLNYSGGYPKFSNATMRNGSGNLNLWAWDWLSMYYYEFHFENRKVGADTLYFSIFLLNDSGFFESYHQLENKISKTSVSKFNDVEKSKSELILVVGKNMWEGWGYNWDEKKFILEDTGKKEGVDKNKLMIFKHYSLDKFYTEEEAIKSLNDFESFCESMSINFKVSNSIMRQNN
jgi:hypothetical protein